MYRYIYIYTHIYIYRLLKLEFATHGFETQVSGRLGSGAYEALLRLSLCALSPKLGTWAFKSPWRKKTNLLFQNGSFKKKVLKYGTPKPRPLVSWDQHSELLH